MNSSWSEDPLASDIHAYLKLREIPTPTFYGQSKQLGMRRYLVDWLAAVSETLNLNDATYHLSVWLLDYFMEDCELEHGQLHLASLCCLLLAAKFEECDKCVPSVFDLNRFIPRSKESHLPDSYNQKEYLAMELRIFKESNLPDLRSQKEYLAMELRIFKHYNFTVGQVTCMHYLHYYTQYLVADDDHMDGVITVESGLLRPCCCKFIKYFSDLSLQNTRFREFRPSIVACSCIVAMRVALHLTPVWPHRLKIITDTCIEELQTCVYELLSCSEVGTQIVEDMKKACVDRRFD